ncbi:MAG: hypothetical protein ACR2MO_02425 [Acidimicrobiales bacterium]
MRVPPLVVMEGCSAAALDHVCAEAADAGWRVVEGWGEAGHGVVCRGRVDSAADAERAVLAAVCGAGLVLEASAGREVLDRLCDDLRRLGPVRHLLAEPAGAAVLGAEERALLGLLLGGTSLGEAARALRMSRRTADRRLSSARRALGASTTAEAMVAATRLGVRPVSALVPGPGGSPMP